MRVEVHLYSQSAPCTFENVRNAYTKDGLFCVMNKDTTVYKFPLQHIFRVKEEGGPKFEAPKQEEHLHGYK